MGLALENFDGAGKFRETEKGNRIDVSGTLDGKPFQDVRGLAEAVRNHPALPKCLVQRAYTYAAGREVSRESQPLIEYFNTRFASDGYQLRPLMRMIALSSSFASVGGADVRKETNEASIAAPASESR